MLKNCKAKGSRNERRSRKHMEARGFFVVRAGGSLGPMDLLCVRPRDAMVIGVQVKSNGWPSPAERKRLSILAREFHRAMWMIEIHRWNDGGELKIRDA